MRTEEELDIESVPAPIALRGGGEDGTEGDSRSEDSFDDEEPQPNAQLVNGAGTAKDTIKSPEEEEKQKKNRRRFGLCLLILLLLAAVLVWLFGFSDVLESETTARASAVETLAPSQFPTVPPTTSTPTTSPSTSVPSVAPTANPTLSVTFSPTFSTNTFLSALSCEELIVSEVLQEFPQGIPFKENYTTPDGSYLCADTYVGFPDSDTRNPWTARIGQKNCFTYNYTAGTEICEEVGARRCTADELQFGVGQGTGCFGDNTLLYSSTECELDGVEGIYTVNLELKANATFFECETDLSTETVVRCCGDHEENYLL